MNLLAFEVKKILAQPMVLIFLGLCVLFNSGWILTADLDQAYLTYLDTVKADIGTQVTTDFKKDSQTLPKGKKKERLLHSTNEVNNVFTGSSGSLFAKKVTDFYQIEGKFKRDIEEKYEKLTPIIQDLDHQQAALDLAVSDSTMSYFTFIRNVLSRFLIVEGLLFGLLMGLYVSTSEQTTKTEGLLFTTKTGRTIQKNKYIVGLCISVSAYALLAISSFSLFAIVYPLGNVWRSSISTFFHRMIYFPEALELPFTTWSPMTVARYTLYTVLLGLLLTVAVFSLHFIAGLWLENIYKGVVITITLVTLHKGAFIWAMQKSCWSLFKWLGFSLIAAWENQTYWFTEMGPFSIIPFQEIVVVLLSLVFTGIGLGITRYYYPKKEVL